MELWKFIEGYDGRYEISNLGRVRSNRGTQKLLRLNTKAHYPRVHLSNPDKTLDRVAYVHVLVAEHFLIKPNGEDLVVNHIDEIKTNCRCDNLEWVTRKYNVAYSIFNALTDAEKLKFMQHCIDNNSHLIDLSTIRDNAVLV